MAGPSRSQRLMQYHQGYDAQGNPADWLDTSVPVPPDTTPPVLSAAGLVTVGSTTATVTITTNEAGVLSFVGSPSATKPTPPQIEAGLIHTGAAGVSPGAQTPTVPSTCQFNLTGLTPVATYYGHFVEHDAAGNYSTVVSTGAFTTMAVPDTTAPLLTLPTGAATGATTVTGTVSTNEGNGILYAAALPAATTPTVPAIKAGASQAVSSTGVKTFNISGKAAGVSYRMHYYHEDAALNPSSIVSSTSFTTSATAGIADQTILFGADTPAGAGGAKARDNEGNYVDITAVSGAGATGWTVTTGYITKSSLPTATTFTCATALGSFTATIAVETNARDVRNETEFNTAMGAVGATATPVRICIRADPAAGVLTWSDAWFYPRTNTGVITIEGRNQTYGKYARLNTASVAVPNPLMTDPGNFTFKYLKIYADFDRTVHNYTGSRGLSIAGTSRGPLRFQFCEICGTPWDTIWSGGHFRGLIGGDMVQLHDFEISDCVVHDSRRGISMTHNAGSTGQMILARNLTYDISVDFWLWGGAPGSYAASELDMHSPRVDMYRIYYKQSGTVERAANLAGVSDGTQCLLRTQIEFDDILVSTYDDVFFTLAGITLQRMGADGKIKLIAKNTAGTDVITLTTAAAIGSFRRVQVLVSLNAAGTSQLTVGVEGYNAAWTWATVSTGAVGGTLDFTGPTKISNDSSEHYFTASHFWMGISPDTSNAGVRANFADAVGMVTDANHAAMLVAYPNPVINLYQGRDETAAGTQPGTGGNFDGPIDNLDKDHVDFWQFIPGVPLKNAILSKFVMYSGRFDSLRDHPRYDEHGGQGVFSEDTGSYSVQSTNRTVTMTIVSSDVNETAHGLVAGNPVVFTTTGALPTGLTAGVVYYVSATGLTANTYRVGATAGGAVITMSGTTSGAIIRQMAISTASPAVVTEYNHGLNNGETVAFSLVSGGVMATGLAVHTPYYVINKTATSYQLSLTSGGAAINTTTPMSGTLQRRISISVSSPAVVTENTHGFVANDPVCFTCSGNTPTGITESDGATGVGTYYVKSPTANTYQLSATPGGVAVNTSAPQTGPLVRVTHYIDCSASNIVYIGESSYGVRFSNQVRCIIRNCTCALDPTWTTDYNSRSPAVSFAMHNGGSAEWSDAYDNVSRATGNYGQNNVLTNNIDRKYDQAPLAWAGLYVGDGAGGHRSATFASIKSVFAALPAGELDGTIKIGALTTAGAWVTPRVLLPTLVSLLPADGEPLADLNTLLVITASEPIYAGSGSVRLYKASDNSLVQTFTVGTGAVVISNRTATMDPTAALTAGASYYARYDTGAFVDFNGNPLTGILDSTSWLFTALTPVTYETETTAFLARLGAPVSGSREIALNNFIKAMKTAGIFGGGKIEILQEMRIGIASGVNADSHLNIIANDHNLTGAPSALISTQYTASGIRSQSLSTAQCLDTGLNPVTETDEGFTQNSATMLFYLESEVAPRDVVTMGSGNSRITVHTTAHTVAWRPNVNATQTFTPNGGATYDATGLWGVIRASSSLSNLWHDAAKLSSPVVGSSALSSTDLFIFNSAGTAGSTIEMCLSMVAFGGGLNDTEYNAFRTAYAAYRTATGL